MMTNRCAACGLDVYDGGQLCPICRADPPPGFAPNGENSRVESSTDSGLTDLQRAAVKAIATHGGVMKAARALGCNHGVISLAAKGEDFPKARHVLGLPPKAIEVRPCPECGELHEQKATCPHELQKARKRPRRRRLHYECGRGESGRERKAAIASEMQALGCESFTQLVDVLLLDRKIRLGICPDCGNDRCMADGVHGLWCPACDASYLLERKRANE